MYTTYAPRNARYTTSRTSTTPASSKQMAFLGSLIADLQPLNPDHAADLVALVSAPGFTSRQASNAIDLLQVAIREERRLARLQAAASVDGALMTPLAPGMYQTPAGDLVKVQAARGTGNLYGKTLVSQDGGETYAFTYTPGATRGLTQDHRLTLDAAKAWGRRTGTCCNCGALLTDPVSVDAGIGPICAGRI